MKKRRVNIFLVSADSVCQRAADLEVVLATKGIKAVVYTGQPQDPPLDWEMQRRFQTGGLAYACDLTMLISSPDFASDTTLNQVIADSQAVATNDPHCLMMCSQRNKKRIELETPGQLECFCKSLLG